MGVSSVSSTGSSNLVTATDLGVDVPRCEQLTWRHTLDRLRAAEDRRGVAALTAMDPDPARWTYSQWQDKQKLILKTDPRMRAVGRELLLRRPHGR